MCTSVLCVSQSTNISGIINTYASVSGFSGDTITVSSSAGFSAGDKLLIIQMQGATIDQSNTSGFGDITNINDAGNYEFTTVCSIPDATTIIVMGIQRTYDPSGIVQIVGVPVYHEAVITGMLTAPTWDGSTGGVLTFECTGTLTMNDAIDLQGLGFRGGSTTTSAFSCAWFSDPSDYHYDINTGEGAMKGEGVALYITGKTAGRGAQANGGGGGNDHNSGGGGGGNANTGGQGGERIRPSTFTCRGISPGVGGKSNTYSNALNKIFLGGGGGSGHENNPATATAGSNGGGIVIVKADTIIGNGNAINVEGASVSANSADGAGGAGAGGTVLLDVSTYIGTLAVNASGGDGGNVANVGTSNCNGPGGGGSGGVLWVNQSSVSPNIVLSNNGGANGTTLTTTQSNCTLNGSNSSTPGSTGVTRTDLSIIETVCSIPLTIQSATICNSDSSFLAGSWQFSSGIFYDTLNTGCCDSIVETTLTLLPALTGTINETICDGDSIVVNGITYNTSVTGATEVFTSVGPNGCDSTVTINLTVLSPLASVINQTICDGDSIVVNGTTYNTSVTGATEVFTNVGPNGCDSTVTINLTVLSPLASVINQTICDGDSIVVNGTTYNTSVIGATEVFTSVGPNGCDSTVTINLTVLSPLEGVINQTICDGDSIVVNGTTYNTSVTGATEVFTNIGPNGCDSTVTINLNVLSAIDTSTAVVGLVMSSNQTGANYQWIDCNDGNSPISGATSASYTATNNGSYAVVVSVGSCSDTSACINITNVGVIENSFGQDLRLFPNPTNGDFSVDLGQNYNSITITIIDLSGKVIQSGTYIEGQLLNLNLKQPEGIYLLTIESEGQKAVIRLIKE